jgi:hypothetical protein
VCGTSVCARRADGGGETVALIDHAVGGSAPVVSPDGKLLVFVRETRPAVPDLWIVELGPEGVAAPPAAAPRPLITAERAQFNPDISPDGRFITYASSESGTFAVYVTGFPSGQGKWAISPGYGARPRWGRKGDRLYFVDALRRIAVMEVDLSAAFEPGRIVDMWPSASAPRLTRTSPRFTGSRRRPPRRGVPSAPS